MTFNHKKYSRDENSHHHSQRISIGKHKILPSRKKWNEKKRIYSSIKSPSDLEESNPIILECKNEVENNLPLWIRRIIPHIRSKFGEIAKCLEDDKDKTFKTSTKVDYPDEIILREAAKSFIKKKEDHEENKIKAWGEIEKHISSTSMTMITSHKDFKDCRENDDLIAFWKLIKLVHTINTGNADFTGMKLEYTKQYLCLKQLGSQSIRDYYEDHVSVLQKLKTILSDNYMNQNYSDKIQGRCFIKGLDERRYGNLIAECERDKDKYPQSLVSAYHDATNYKTLQNGVLRQADLNHHGGKVAAHANISGVSNREKKVIMAMRHDQKQHIRPETKNRTVLLTQKKNDQGKPERTPRCSFCGASGHWNQNCEKMKAFHKNHQDEIDEMLKGASQPKVLVATSSQSNKRKHDVDSDGEY
jgi:hypothetical protein